MLWRVWIVPLEPIVLKISPTVVVALQDILLMWTITSALDVLLATSVIRMPCSVEFAHQDQLPPIQLHLYVRNVLQEQSAQVTLRCVLGACLDFLQISTNVRPVKQDTSAARTHRLVFHVLLESSATSRTQLNVNHVLQEPSLAQQGQKCVFPVQKVRLILKTTHNVLDVIQVTSQKLTDALHVLQEHSMVCTTLHYALNAPEERTLVLGIHLHAHSAQTAQ
jgi:hypothetical protein